MRTILKWLLLNPKDKIIKIRSWKPSYGQHGLEWPSLLIDRNGYQRETITPVWDHGRFVDIYVRARTALL